MNEDEILIVGAGPAGAATSLFLSGKKIKHTLIDKAVFPRDKVCGDALSGKVVHVLNKLNPEFVKDFEKDSLHYTGSYGICFYSPNGRMLEVPFSMNPKMLKNAPGFISRRIHFDNYLFNKLDKNYAHVLQSTELVDLKRINDGLLVTLKSAQGIQEKKVKLIVGAEGERSIVAKKLLPVKKNLSNYCAALRVYYKDVKDTHRQNYIELHFLKEILPGYFWIFPMNDGTANVGIGMLSQSVSEKKINLRQKLNDIIKNHPVISKRFAGAVAEDAVEGWGLPLGSARRRLSGDNFLLTGDAGSLIDPFTGEGIGNAIFSGMHAAEIIEKAITENKFDAHFLLDYDKKLYRQLNDELSLSHGIQKLAHHAWLFNFVVRKASKNKMLRETITCMFDDLDIRSRLRKPSFYFRLIFN